MDALGEHFIDGIACDVNRRRDRAATTGESNRAGDESIDRAGGGVSLEQAGLQ
jgi:hypothetical protein